MPEKVHLKPQPKVPSIFIGEDLPPRRVRFDENSLINSASIGTWTWEIQVGVRVFPTSIWFQSSSLLMAHVSNFGVKVPKSQDDKVDWKFMSFFQMGWDALIESITLPEPNIASENRPFQKETHIPTIHFQVRTVSFREDRYFQDGSPEKFQCSTCASITGHLNTSLCMLRLRAEAVCTCRANTCLAQKGSKHDKD